MESLYGSGLLGLGGGSCAPPGASGGAPLPPPSHLGAVGGLRLPLCDAFSAISRALTHNRTMGLCFAHPGPLKSTHYLHMIKLLVVADFYPHGYLILCCSFGMDIGGYLLGILHAGGLLDFLLLQEEELPTASEHKAIFDRCNRMLNQEEAEGKKRVEGLGWVGCGLHAIHRWALG